MTAITINKVIDMAKSELEENRKALLPKRPFCRLEKKDFLELLSIEAEKILISRNQRQLFVIDDNNKDIISSLHAYLIGDRETINLNKGIMLAGAIGSGKTLIMKAYCNLIEKVTPKIIEHFHAMKLASIIREKGVERKMTKIPIFIDDLGKEEESVKSYGTDIRPLTELIAMRYDEGAWTFATTNYKMDTLREKYTPHTTDRMIEMFNYLILKGESRRK